ncbi:MAG: hypothetical protein ACOZF0_10080 [Thermodesulfobacteriota bacterium]
MKTFQAVLVLTALLAFMPPICLGGRHDFRKVDWGQPRKKIRAAEAQKPLSAGDDQMVFEARLLGREMLVKYWFSSDRLIGATYEPVAPHLNENKYMQDFADFTAILTEKYGQPKEDQKIWKGGDYFKNEPSQWGAAVSTGKLTCRTIWINDKTEIELLLTGANFNVTFEINYWSREWKHLARPTTADRPIKRDLSDIQRKEAMDNF